MEDANSDPASPFRTYMITATLRLDVTENSIKLGSQFRFCDCKEWILTTNIAYLLIARIFGISYTLFSYIFNHTELHIPLILISLIYIMPVLPLQLKYIATCTKWLVCTISICERPCKTVPIGTRWHDERDRTFEFGAVRPVVLITGRLWEYCDKIKTAGCPGLRNHLFKFGSDWFNRWRE